MMSLMIERVVRLPDDGGCARSIPLVVGTTRRRQKHNGLKCRGERRQPGIGFLLIGSLLHEARIGLAAMRAYYRPEVEFALDVIQGCRNVAYVMFDPGIVARRQAKLRES